MRAQIAHMENMHLGSWVCTDYNKLNYETRGLFLLTFRE